jgi:hypothetical protein
MISRKPRSVGKREEIDLDAATRHLLEECRTIIPGIQALFGFQLIAVFNDGFTRKLTYPQQLTHLVSFVLTAIAMALVMTPAALHRQSEPRSVSERFIGLSSKIVLAALVILAVGLSLDAYLVSLVVIGNSAIGSAIGLALLVAFLMLWMLVPQRESRKYGGL